MARTGKEYIEGLRDGRELYVNGELVRDVTQYVGFQGIIDTIAGLYDIQHDPAYRDILTYPSPKTGQPVNYSFLIPETWEQFQARMRCERVRCELTYGMMGRLPDFVNANISSWASLHKWFGRNERRFGENTWNYYELCRDNDLCLTHILVDPQIDRGKTSGLLGGATTPEAMHVVGETDAGLLVSGARMLSTLAPVSDEIQVAAFSPRKPGEEDYCILGVIPCATPGIKIIAREPYDTGRSHFDRPLTSRFDEGDAIITFDNVLFPWERIFSARDIETYNLSFGGVRGVNSMQVLVRPVAKLRFMTGLACLVANSVGRQEVQRYQEMIGEMVANVDLAELMLYGAARASWDAWELGRRQEAGLLTEAEASAPRPPANFINMQRFFMTHAFSKINEYMRLLGSSGLVMTPTEADFANPGEIDDLAIYMRGAGMPANRRVATMKLAWDAFATEFGSRQETYEWFFAAHPIDNRVNQYKTKLRQDCEAYAQQLLDSIWAEQEAAAAPEKLPT